MTKRYSVKDINKVVKNNLIIIVAFMMIGAVFAGVYAKKKQSTTYTAKAMIIVGQNLSHTDYKNSAVQAEMGMMKSYEDVVESGKTTAMAHKLLSKKDQKKISTGDLKKDVNAKSRPDSLVMTISSSTGNSNRSVKMANAVAKASTSQIEKYSPLSSKVQVLSMSSNKMVTSETHPSVKKYTVLGAALGILIGMVISFSLTTWKND